MSTGTRCAFALRATEKMIIDEKKYLRQQQKKVLPIIDFSNAEFDFILFAKNYSEFFLNHASE